MDLSKSSYLSLAIDLSKSSYHSRWISQKSSYLLKTVFIKVELSTLRKGFIKDKTINRRIPAYAFSQISLFLACLLSSSRRSVKFYNLGFPTRKPAILGNSHEETRQKRYLGNSHEETRQKRKLGNYHEETRQRNTK